MKVNEFIQENPSRSILPKIKRNESGGKTDSPFTMPQDAQIFRMKQKQRDRKRQEKAQKDKMKIWEKGLKKQGITIKQLNDLGKQQINQEQNQTKMSLIEAAKNAIKNRVKINQPMHQFISKKRQTLLFQMLIDHKRQKINEFQDLTRLHRKGLQRAQKMLQQDMQAFNSYLNQNKKQARQAIKKAQLQTREKNQKVSIIKQKLQVQADLTGKNMSKRQTLQNLRKYKLFLDSLNPDVSQEERKKIHQKIQKQQQQAQNFGGINMNQDFQDSQQDQMIFFKQPGQLIDIFQTLQQSNLNLITHLKEMQQQIEEAKGIFNTKKDLLSKKKNDLILNKNQIGKQISQVDDEIQQLKKTTNKDQISSYFSSLEDQIVKISKQMGFISLDQKHLNALELLKDIEQNIQKQLQFLQNTKNDNPLVIHNLQKACIIDKRQKKRLKNQQLQQKEIKKNIESSPQREKRKGRPIMARSIIKKQEKKKQVEIEEPEQQIQKRKYLM